MQKLYDSVDLSDKLIVLEDLERTNIPIKDVLGYVNNLVEQDGIKVLLVANESEILKRVQVVVGKDKEGKDTKEWRWTAETQEYLKIKEKTISDTVPYVCDLLETIENIVIQFKDEKIENFLIDKLDVKETETPPQTEQRLKIERELLYFEIISIANKIGDMNLRSFIFACQKTTDILRLYNAELDKTFVKHLFMSIVAFSFRLKINDKLYWDDEQSGSSLGTARYPLYKFAHDYIKFQSLSVDEVKKAEEGFLEQKKAESMQNKANFCLDILFDFYATTPQLLECAIAEIKQYLEKSNVIGAVAYGKLANYLIAVRNLIATPSLVDDCKEIMRRNLENGNYDARKVSSGLSWHDSLDLWTDAQKIEYKEFIAEMQSIIKNKRNEELDVDCTTESVDAFTQAIIDNRDDYINQRTFLKRVDIAKLVEVIKQCTSKQISDLRRAINVVYAFSNINEFFMDDKPALVQLKTAIEDLLRKEILGDKIKELQLSWFVGNLENILEKLN